MENGIFQAGKDPQASAHTDRCSEVPSNFPRLPSTRTTESELWTQALSFLLCLGLFFHLLHLFLLFFYKQTRREILLKPFTNLQNYKKPPILVLFSHLAFPSHILQVFLGHFSSPACLTDVVSSLMIFPFPQPELRVQFLQQLVHTCVTIIATPLFSSHLITLLSLTTHTTPWFLGSSGFVLLNLCRCYCPQPLAKIGNCLLYK